MKKRMIAICLALAMLFACLTVWAETPEAAPETDAENTGKADTAGTVRMSEDELYDRVLGSWLGQMIGVGWGSKTEFSHCGTIIPENEMPAWDGKSMYADAYSQDDLYMEIPFLDAMVKNGYDCDTQYAANNLAKTDFPLWHGNLYARMNAQAGTPAGMCGLPANNPHYDDIDYQIDVDFLGTMYPGLVNEAAERAFKVGHLIGYGDGVYGGVFVSALHAAAYTASSVEQIVETATNVIPEGSGYRDALDTVWECYRAGKTWEETWETLENKFNTGESPCPDTGSRTPGKTMNIDAKLNGAYIAIGLLYGKGDFADSVIIACRCGQDSDCNPSNVGSVLGTYYGRSGLDEKYVKDAAMDGGMCFRGSVYTLRDVVDGTFGLLKDILKDSKLVSQEDGKWVLPESEKLKQVPLEQGKPADVTVILKPLGGRRVAVMLETRGTDVSKCTYDMGDGFTTDEPLAMYTYEKAGTYKPKFTIITTDGKTVEAEKEITVPDDPAADDEDNDRIIICHVAAPKGGGSRDISVICDGKVSTDAAESYDTFTSKMPGRTGVIGYLFRKGKEISMLRLSEGPHFNDGGWFKGAPDLQLLVGGEWVKPEYTVKPEYPVGDEKETFEPAGLSYDFILDKPVKCDGVRLRGECGGTAGFISVSELTVR